MSTQTLQKPTVPAPAAKEKAPSVSVMDPDFERLLLQDPKTEIRFTPFAAEQEIRLSVPLIQKYVAVPYFRRDGNELKRYDPSVEECVKFLMLCRARQLNPWEGDAYMVPFWDEKLGGPKWSLVTAHQCFLKRAQVSNVYDGMESGIIAQDAEKNIVYREGDFYFPGDTILGGWAIVYTKNQSHPTKSRMNLHTYKQPFGRWMKDPAGMIVKVAEADALRRTFPTMLGDLKIEEEVETTPSAVETKAKKPAEFTGPGGGRAGFTDSPKVLPPVAPGTPEAPDDGEPHSTTPPEKAPGKPNGAQGAPVKEKIQTKTTPPEQKATETTTKPVTGRANRPTMVEQPTDPGQSEMAPEAEGEAAPETPPQDKAPFEPDPNENEALQNIRFLCHTHDITEAQLVKWCKTEQVKLLKETQNEIADMASMKLLNLGKLWQNNPVEFRGKVMAANA